MIKNILRKTTSIDPLDAELLLAHVLKKNREHIVAHPEKKISLISRFRFHHLVQKRQRGIPLALLTHHKAFYGLDFFVTKHTLVPRPDTEVLVDEAVSMLSPLKGGSLPCRISASSTESQAGRRGVLLIDIGTGTGCIPIAIMKSLGPGLRALKHESIKSNLLPLKGGGQEGVQCIATDISQKALRVAKKNAKKHGVDMNFLHGNLLKPIKKYSKVFNRKSEIVITANLPYLTQEQFDNEPSIQHEPKVALVANNNGLALYDELLRQIKQLAHGYRLSAINCFFEIDPTQSSSLADLIHRHFPDAVITIKKDLAGKDRVVVVKISS